MTRGQAKLLVTGGAGFIGSHLVQKLIHEGKRVAVVDNFDEFYPAALKRENIEEIGAGSGIRWYEADIRDRAAMQEVFREEMPDTIVHLAARAGVRPSIEQPILYNDVNVTGTLNLLDLARGFEVRKFVFGSSSSVYGAASRSPFIEDQVDMKPLSPYAATKLSGELLCYTYSHLYDISTICLRFFTVYGPRQRPDLAIRKFAELMRAEKPIPIFGDGSSGRDYTYVDDIVSGILAATEYESRFDVFNLGNSHPVKLLDLIGMLEEVTGRRASLEFLPAQPGDVPFTCADISKAHRQLGYEPRTELRDGLDKFWSWLEEGRSRIAPGAGSAARR